MKGIRKKMNPIMEEIEEKVEERGSISTTPSPDNNLPAKRAREYTEKEENKGPNFLLILSSIKNQIDEAELEEKVQLYKKVILDDLYVKRVSKKKRPSAPKTNLNESINSLEGTQGAEEDFEGPSIEEKLREELHQPYIFRDSNLNTAENILIF